MAQRTDRVFTKGITNLPVGELRSSYRFLFFELDSKREDKLNAVLEVYKDLGLAVYYHETTHGYHFYSLRPIPKTVYWSAIRRIKILNPACPLTTLRLKPNKWQEEKKFWKNGTIIANVSELDTGELYAFKDMLERQQIGLIARRYQVINYPFEFCSICEKSDMISFNFSIGSFYCRRCREPVGANCYGTTY